MSDSGLQLLDRSDSVNTQCSFFMEFKKFIEAQLKKDFL